MPKVVPGYKEEAKKRILESALRVFSEKGYRQSTMDDVAKAVGVSKGAIYIYFKSKEDLFGELCRANPADLSRELRSAFNGVDPIEGSKRFFEGSIETAVETAGFYFDSVAEASRNDAIRNYLLNKYKISVDEITRFLVDLQKKGQMRRDIDARDMALAFVALYEGLHEILNIAGDKSEAVKAWVACSKAFFSDGKPRSTTGH